MEDTELFDYELEVMPILEVLVGRVVEQSRMELIEELEMKQFRENRVTSRIRKFSSGRGTRSSC